MSRSIPIDAESVAGYRHTQTGPWFLVLYVFGILMLGLGWFLPSEPVVLAILPVTGAIVLFLAISFQSLTVADEGDRLAIRFGPLLLVEKRIRYADMRAVEPGRTTLLDGWGIHLSLRGGWVWNIWGWDCVVIHHDGKTWLGTDDAENLVRFLKTKLPVPDDDRRAGWPSAKRVDRRQGRTNCGMSS